MLVTGAGSNSMTLTFHFTLLPLYNILKFCKQAGCGAVWLARMVWDHEVVSSNLTIPIVRL